MKTDELERLATRVLDAAFEVHRSLGPGLLESAYEMGLCHELATLGIGFERQKEMPVRYKGVSLDCGYRIDLLVCGEIVLELKCVDTLQPIHEAQLLTYMKLAQKPIGFLMNFNVRLLKHGLKRIVNGLAETNASTECIVAPVASSRFKIS